MSDGEVRPLLGLAGSECLRTFTDNVLRAVVIFLLIRPHEREADVQEMTTLANLAYVAPWIVLSVLAGWLADRMSKRSVLLGLKVVELAVMALAAVVLTTGPPLVLLLLVVLVGTVSALASPCKYGILPELLPPERLSRGNGWVLFWTYVAIPAGMAFGGLLLDLLRGRQWAIGGCLALVALLGLGFTRRIPRVAAARPSGGFWASFVEGWRALTGSRRLRWGLAGNVWYWTLAALVSQDIVVYAKTVLGLSDTDKGRLLAAVTLGIGVGAAAAGRASRGRIRLALVPIGMTAMAGVTALYGLLVPGFGAALALSFALGLSAGFYVVPITGLIQLESPAASRGSVIAVMNVFVFAGIGVGSAVAWALAGLGLSSPDILLVSAGLVALGAGVSVRLGMRGLGPHP